VIGEIFDKVYNYGSLTSAAATDVQTVSVAPGGATVAEITFEVPGRYLLVDHALSRPSAGWSRRSRSRARTTGRSTTLATASSAWPAIDL
jgi:hypothetical protein